MEYEDLVKIREEVKKEHKYSVKRVLETIVVLGMTALFAFWIYMSFVLPIISGGTSSTCIDRAGNAYYCGD